MEVNTNETRPTCQRCEGTRVASLSAKSSDANFITLNGKDHDGYVLPRMGVGEGDYVEINWCLDCGQIQGRWPRPRTKLER